MKKLVNTSFAYLIFALISGVFYREFTKFNGYTGKTTLGVVHTHLFILGVLLFLILALFAKDLAGRLNMKKLNRFYWLHHIAMILFSATLLTRGIIQVKNMNLSSSKNAMLSGIAGVSHILITVSLILFFGLIKDFIKNSEDK
ncbi:MAG: DUF2871 domain-containing protein [Eubacteriales bacterium]|nr:DUF2871 domain-containing protein [Eubacteriales bacterium]